MTAFFTDPLGRRTWVLPLPIPGRPRRRDAFREAVDGRTVLITGASSGIGRAAALKIGRAGATVLLVARSEEELGKVSDELASAGGEASVYPTDLSDGDQIDRLLERAHAEHDAVDILINNAAHSIRRPVKHSMDRLHDYERTMQLNYRGALQLVLGVLPAMRERRSGHVINVSTMGVQWGAPRFSAYLASKAALDAFTRVTAAEMTGTGIDFTTIHMPLVRTPMIEPTRLYDAMPAISAEQAANWICEAVRVRPRTMDLPVGPVGEAAYALVPGLVDRMMNRAFRAVR